MPGTGTLTEISSAAELRELLGTPASRTLTKERTWLHARDVEWLAASPFCLVATCAADGTCDVSPKGDPPGFALVLDEQTIAIPERPFDDMIVKGHRPRLAVLVEIEQIFFHCMKALMRSRLWEPESWNPDAVPPHAQIVKGVQPCEETLEDLERRYGPQYESLLYG